MLFLYKHAKIHKPNRICVSQCLSCIEYLNVSMYNNSFEMFVFFCRSIMTDLYYLSQADGVGEWRMKEAKDLSDLVQNRITYLQVTTDTPAAQPTGLSLVHTHARTHTVIYIPTCRRRDMVSIHSDVSLTHTDAHMLFLRTSFTLPCLICTIHNCQHQFPQGAGEGCDSSTVSAVGSDRRDSCCLSAV